MRHLAGLNGAHLLAILFVGFVAITAWHSWRQRRNMPRDTSLRQCALCGNKKPAYLFRDDAYNVCVNCELDKA